LNPGTLLSEPFLATFWEKNQIYINYININININKFVLTNGVCWIYVNLNSKGGVLTKLTKLNRGGKR